MQNIRQQLRNKRKKNSKAYQKNAAKNLAHQVQKITNFRCGLKIAVYQTNDGEIDTEYLKKNLENNKISIYLPILDNKKLKFAKISPYTKINKFGIIEPIKTQILSAKKMNIIFMPLVGFDKDKNRIGMGGGFYDRTLSFRRQQKIYRYPKLYALAFDFQKLEKITPTSWDIVPDKIITPNKIYS